MSEIIKVEHLRYVYNAGMPDETAALDDVSFSIEKGDFVGVMGSTGSGQIHADRPFQRPEPPHQRQDHY